MGPETLRASESPWTAEMKQAMRTPTDDPIVHMLTNLELSGAQRAVAHICAELRARGWNVQLVYSRRGGRVPGREDHLLQFLEERSIPVHEVPSMVRSVNAARDLVALAETTKLFRRIQPALVHTHMSKAGILGRLAARRVGVPRVVHSARGWSFHHATNGLAESTYVGIERFLVRFTDCTLGVSAATVEEGLSRGIGSSDHYRVVRSGIDLAPFHESSGRRSEVRAELGVQPDTPLVGIVAEISAAKAPHDFLAIAQRVHEALPEARFVWAGTGPMKDEAQAEATRAGLDGVLTWLGQRDDVAPLYNALDVYLLPSHFEGLSRTVVEALCSGVPVVATRVGGHEEVLQHGNQGWLAASGDVNGLADHVLSLLKDPDLRTRMAANALQTDLSGFGLDAVVGEHEALYRELLSGHPVG